MVLGSVIRIWISDHNDKNILNQARVDSEWNCGSGRNHVPEGHGCPVAKASNFRHSDQPTLGVLIGWQVYEGTLNSFLQPLLQGIHKAARDHSCNLLLACGIGHGLHPGTIRPAWPEPSDESDFVPVGPWNTDGLIVITPLLSESRSAYVQRLIAEGHPVIFLGTGEQGASVVIDNARGVEQSILHLIEHGHRRIAFIGDTPHTRGDGKYRLNAYRAAVKKYGLDVDPQLISYGNHFAMGGQTAVEKMLADGVQFTALMASNDEMAFGAIKALRAGGLRVPDDIAVTGFDDRLETLGENPSLTSVHYPVYEAGLQALELCLKVITGEAAGNEIVHVPTRLVIRESCGCQPGSQDCSANMMQNSRSAAVSVIFDTPDNLVRSLTEAVLSEVRFISPDTVENLCRELVYGFITSLEDGDASAFHAGLMHVLQQVDTNHDDEHAWQAAISVLRDYYFQLEATHPTHAGHQFVVCLLDQARLEIISSARRQYSRNLVAQSELDDRVAYLAAQLLAVPDKTPILETLATALPDIGLSEGWVAFFEAIDSDPVARSIAHKLSYSDPAVVTEYLLTYEFPPRQAFLEHQPLHLALLPLTFQDEALGFVAFEIANLGLLGALVRELATTFKSATLYQEAAEGRRLAEEANRLKSRFLSMVSHELRTPMGVITGLSNMLLMQQEQGQLELPSSSRQDIERIQASAQHLSGLIGDVLDLAQSEAGRLHLDYSYLDLAEALRPALVVGRQLAREKGLKWRADIPPNVPPILGDRVRLRQIALNLISNAVKFTEQGQVSLQVLPGEGTVSIIVQDTGIGIPPGEQDTIFKEFERSVSSITQGQPGLGLGLAICRQLVHLHGGTIRVDSSGQAGEGTTFTVLLPAMDEILTAEGSTTVVILHGEDISPAFRQLPERGLTVRPLRLDQHGVWLAEVPELNPIAIMLALSASSQMGWQTLNLLREYPPTQNIPVLFFDLAEDRDIGNVLELDYVTKPIQANELIQTLYRHSNLDSDDGAEKRILIVDDEPMVLATHARIVSTQLPQCKLMTAQNGREALEQMAAYKPDLVLTDLMMPEMDGFQVIEAMQAQRAYRDIPVIILTGKVLDEADMARLNKGVAGILSKGVFSTEEIFTHIEAALGRHRKLGTEARRLVRKAMAYMHDHFADLLSREEIARYVSVSEGYLTRCFHQEMGISPLAYLNRYRIWQAKGLLSAGGQTITEIALAVGFSDSNYFGRVFRREVGKSPSEYMRSCMSEGGAPATGTAVSG